MRKAKITKDKNGYINQWKVLIYDTQHDAGAVEYFYYWTTAMTFACTWAKGSIK